MVIVWVGDAKYCDVGNDIIESFHVLSARRFEGGARTEEVKARAAGDDIVEAIVVLGTISFRDPIKTGNVEAYTSPE